MDKGLLAQALGKFLLGVVLLGVLIFLPAWSLRYWQGYAEYKKKVKYRILPYIW